MTRGPARRRLAGASPLSAVAATALRATAALADGGTTLASDLVDSIGVNTHLIWDDSTYDDVDLVMASLDHLGVRHVRDTLFNNRALLDRIGLLGEHGIRFDLFVNGEVGAPINGLAWQVAEMARLAPYVEAIEGPNETDTWPVTWEGLTGFPATRAAMAALGEAVRATPELAGVPIVQTSFGSRASYRAFGDGTALADVANAHSYFSHGAPPGETLGDRAGEALAVTRTGRVISTEAGYHTATGVTEGWVGLDEGTHAAYTVRLLLEQYHAGVERTYLYELFDFDTDGAPDDPELHFGLFEDDGTPKRAATAIRALTGLLGRSSGDPFDPMPLDVALAGPATVHGLMLQRDEGCYSLVVWNEVPSWDYGTATPLDVAPEEVAVTFGGATVDGALYDVLASPDVPTRSFDDLAALSVMVPDHPLVIQLGGLVRPGEGRAGSGRDPAGCAPR